MAKKRCSALTLNNRRCKNKVKDDDSEFCLQHHANRHDGWSGEDVSQVVLSHQEEVTEHVSHQEEVTERVLVVDWSNDGVTTKLLELEADKVALELHADMVGKDVDALRDMLRRAQEALHEAQADVMVLKEENLSLREDIDVLEADNQRLSDRLAQMDKQRVYRKAQALYYHDNKVAVKKVVGGPWQNVKKATNAEFRLLGPENREEYMSRAIQSL
jgi:hypothetical protein